MLFGNYSITGNLTQPDAGSWLWEWPWLLVSRYVLSVFVFRVVPCLNCTWCPSVQRNSVEHLSSQRINLWFLLGWRGRAISQKCEARERVSGSNCSPPHCFSSAWSCQSLTPCRFCSGNQAALQLYPPLTQSQAFSSLCHMLASCSNTIVIFSPSLPVFIRLYL